MCGKSNLWHMLLDLVSFISNFSAASLRTFQMIVIKWTQLLQMKNKTKQKSKESTNETAQYSGQELTSINDQHSLNEKINMFIYSNVNDTCRAQFSIQLEWNLSCGWGVVIFISISTHIKWTTTRAIDRYLGGLLFIVFSFVFVKKNEVALIWFFDLFMHST